MSGHDLSGITYTSDFDHTKDQVAIVVSKWNHEVTDVLLEGAVQTLIHAGLAKENIITHHVPGSFELPLGAKISLEKYAKLDGVICLGCVIQGETRHFDFICQSTADGIMQLGLQTGKPVIFGVLTPDTMEQAQDRAGGKYGNKGQEAAVALLEMLDLKKA